MVCNDCTRIVCDGPTCAILNADIDRALAQLKGETANPKPLRFWCTTECKTAVSTCWQNGHHIVKKPEVEAQP